MNRTWAPGKRTASKLGPATPLAGTRDAGELAIHQTVISTSLAALVLPAKLAAGTKDSPMEIVSSDTAIVITDPQNDFLSPDGATWGLVGANAEANNTVENLQRLLETAQANGYTVFVSPHYYYPTDHGWQFGGTVEVMMHDINMFDRAGALTVDGFKVPVVKDATAAAQHEDLGDGYAAALVNFGYLASEVLSTDEAVARLS